MSGSQDQVARLLALLPYLLSHPGAKVKDVARLFRVSERQLVRDLHVLWFSGLPGLSMGDYIEVDMEAVEGAGSSTSPMPTTSSGRCGCRATRHSPCWWRCGRWPQCRD